MSIREIRAFKGSGAAWLQGRKRLRGRDGGRLAVVSRGFPLRVLIAAFTLQTLSGAHAESTLRTAPSATGGRAPPSSASVSIRIEVVVAPRLQLRTAADESLTLSSNRGSILVACDIRAHCPAQVIGSRGLVDASIARPGGGYTIAQP